MSSKLAPTLRTIRSLAVWAPLVAAACEMEAGPPESVDGDTDATYAELGPDADEPLELRAPEPEGDARELAARAAWDDLAQVYAVAMRRELAQLSDDERKVADAWFRDRGADPFALPRRYTTAGTPRGLVAPGLRITADDLGLPEAAEPTTLALAFVHRFAALWKVDASAFDRAARSLETRDDDVSPNLVSVRFRQHHDELPVVPGTLVVHVDTDRGAIVAVTGGFAPLDTLPPAQPRLTADDAIARAAREGLEPHAPQLAIWSGHRSGRDAEPHLVWDVALYDADGPAHRVLVDALDGEIRLDEALGHGAMQRVHWDYHGDHYTRTCSAWESTWPPVGCDASCAPCAADPHACATCVCPDLPPPVADDPACVDDVWHYDESTGCVADGVPAAEPSCGTDAQLTWDNSQVAYDYWTSRFGRDSWDGAGGSVFTKSGVISSGFAGVARKWDQDGDLVPELAWVAIGDGFANPWLIGHETGHDLQFGTYTDEGTYDSLYGTSGAAMESNADWHGYHYQGLPIFEACFSADLHHYQQMWTAPTDPFAQANKQIGNCQGWLATQTSFASWWHRGVTTTPTPVADFDRIWLRALDAYHHTTDDYFTWWDSQLSAAFDLYGWSPPFLAIGNSTDAVGSWTPMNEMAAQPRPDERVAALGWDGAAQGPCVFYRPQWDSRRIMRQCQYNGTWFQTEPVNDPAVTPAASEPATAYRYESGKIYGYVLWTGTDSRIHYRRIDFDNFSMTPTADLGPSHLASGPVAAAAVWESPTVDRLVVVYHPVAHPTWFYWTYLGSPSAGVDMGPALDSALPPAMTSYPYYSRAYLVRPDSGTGRLRYASYTFAAGWTAPTDLSALYDGEAHMPVDLVRSDTGVALTSSGPGAADDDRLRMAFVTRPRTGNGSSGGRELWYASLSESSPGVLTRGNDRAVPLQAVTPYTSSAPGGLCSDKSGPATWHFWGQGPTAGAPRLHEWRTHSD